MRRPDRLAQRRGAGKLVVAVLVLDGEQVGPAVAVGVAGHDGPVAYPPLVGPELRRAQDDRLVGPTAPGPCHEDEDRQQCEQRHSEHGGPPDGEVDGDRVGGATGAPMIHFGSIAGTSAPSKGIPRRDAAPVEE